MGVFLTGEPLPEATWYKGKKPVKKSKRVKTAMSSETGICQLEIREATVEDSGEYAVKLTNQASIFLDYFNQSDFIVHIVQERKIIQIISKLN